MRYLVVAGLLMCASIPAQAQQSADKVFGEKLFGAWRVACKQDAISDRRSCATFARGLIVILHQEGTLSITMPGKKYPGSSIYLRIDDGQSYRAKEQGWSGEVAAKIASELDKAGKVVTRYEEWPSRGSVDHELDMTGYRDAIEYMRATLGAS